MKDTFSAVEVSSELLGHWRNLDILCQEASIKEQSGWEAAKRVWESGAGKGKEWADYEEYSGAREELLTNLVEVTREPFIKARSFASKCKSGSRGSRDSVSPVLVPEKIMDKIDEIYVNHYHAGEVVEGVNQLLCLSCHRCNHPTTEDGTPDCKSTLINYLADVRSYLNEPDLSSDFLTNSQQVGVTGAAIRVEPLNLPLGLPGRLTLPLPTRTMLEDLWGFIMSADEGLINEACLIRSSLHYMLLTHGLQISHWFEGLGSHSVANRQGGKSPPEKRAHSHSDVIRLKLQSLSQNDSIQKALVLAVRLCSSCDWYRTNHQYRCFKSYTLNNLTLGF
jgi:hypothetical protein